MVRGLSAEHLMNRFEMIKQPSSSFNTPLSCDLSSGLNKKQMVPGNLHL